MHAVFYMCTYAQIIYANINVQCIYIYIYVCVAACISHV